MICCTVQWMLLGTARQLLFMYLSDWGRRSARFISDLLGNWRRNAVGRLLFLIFVYHQMHSVCCVSLWLTVFVKVSMVNQMVVVAKMHIQDVVVVATRRILRPPKKGSAVQRPRTRTLTAVHDAMLEDVVYPAEIVGKRVRFRVDGSKIMKVGPFDVLYILFCFSVS